MQDVTDVLENCFLPADLTSVDVSVHENAACARDVHLWLPPTGARVRIAATRKAHGPPLPCLQALQYMRKLCSHPALVLDPQQPAHVAALNAATGAATEEVAGTWEARVAAVRSQLYHAPKLEALQQLLQVTGVLSVRRTSQAALVRSGSLRHVAAVRPAHLSYLLARQ